jgi:hypothetical protein
VRWPSGTTSTRLNVPRNQTLLISEPAAVPMLIAPGIALLVGALGAVAVARIRS